MEMHSGTVGWSPYTVLVLLYSKDHIHVTLKASFEMEGSVEHSLRSIYFQK